MVPIPTDLQVEEQTWRALEAIDASDKAATAGEALESAAARYTGRQFGHGPA